MLYLIDANVLITAHNTYYPIDRVPEFWAWLHHQAKSGRVKMPTEIMEEIIMGHKEDDLLLDWIKDASNKAALLLDEDVEGHLVQNVVSNGYANDLSDSEVEQIGRDPFLVAYGLAQTGNRCVVTTEVSAPSKQRQNRRVPDVCKTFSQECCGPFVMNTKLNFHTAWKPTK